MTDLFNFKNILKFLYIQKFFEQKNQINESVKCRATCDFSNSLISELQ